VYIISVYIISVYIEIDEEYSDNRMEDKLLLYINFLKGWKEKYILIHDELLYILSEKGGMEEGVIHLAIATVKV